jgi:hypothetical protein
MYRDVILPVFKKNRKLYKIKRFCNIFVFLELFDVLPAFAKVNKKRKLNFDIVDTVLFI